MDHQLRPGHQYSDIEVSGGSSHFGDVIHLPARPETPPEPSSTILPRPDPNFIDREELLERVAAQASVRGAWVALVGLGGVGKTQIAIRYTQRLRTGDSNRWILWIFASNAARFVESIGEVADQIRLPGRQEPKANILQLLQVWLANSKRRWTIVLDNADNADFLLDPPDVADAVRASKRRIDYFPACDHGSVVITSRDKDAALTFVSESDVVEVLPMDMQHATTLLQKKLGSLYNEKSGAALAKTLDFMPLALSQAASFIKQQKRRYTIEVYLAELEKSRRSRTSLLRKHGTVPKSDRDDSSSIILTWQISFEHIYSARRSAADLLALMSFCDRKAIPEILIRSERKRRDSGDAPEAEVGEDGSSFDDDIQMLENFSFTSFNADTTAWDMHGLVQDATQWWLLDRGKVEAVQNEYIKHLHRIVPGGRYENWQAYKTLMPHIKTAIELDLDEQEVCLLWAEIMSKGAWFTESQGLYKDAEAMAKRCLYVRERLLGADHPSTLRSMGNLALTHSNLGQWKEAEELELNVMETSRTVLGADHPDTLRSMNNLAMTYSKQGRWKEAEELEVKVMQTRSTVFGAEHPDTLLSMNNLATTYGNLGRWREAAELKVMVMNIRRTVLGAEHPDTLTSMSNLAATYSDQGRWKEAEELKVKVMQARKTVLGAEHPDTLTSMGNLAVTYRNQGRWKEAEALKVKVVETRKTVLGAEHPDTLTSMGNLISTYLDQGRWKEAEGLGLKVMKTSRTVLGAEHPSTLWSMNNLAITYRNQGRWKEAEELEVNVMVTRKTVLGVEHPDTLRSMASLASTYWNQGRYKEAEELGVEVMETSRTSLGVKHPFTLTSMNNLATTYLDQGRWKQAEELQVKVTETRKTFFGAEHPNTLIGMANLAETFRNQGRWEQAKELGVKVMETWRTVLGADHPDTLTSMNNLAVTYYHQERLQASQTLMKQCVTLRTRVLGTSHPDTCASVASLEAIEDRIAAMRGDEAGRMITNLTIDDLE